MPQKVIFLDIDGTLTEPGGMEPPASACRAMRLARQNGHRLVLCSGRSECLLAPLLRYNFDAVVSSAGGRITCGGKVLFDRSLPLPLLQETADILSRAGVEYTIECREDTYSCLLYTSSTTNPAAVRITPIPQASHPASSSMQKYAATKANAAAARRAIRSLRSS